ncbi:2-oxoglutarate dehydrogenase E1 component [Flavobacteriaceae bacterium]|nr:2-oxoglutarate dehydrogenase E1 component [Flavobacteriaceae bacterium]MDB9901519.1 2-oxoglutarate dehydrogenase E1 component [Flavobacteriaceae bacterium]MDC0958404.1 2-oxoglutarate dehydrogenase E1 component [Flavobacteriaceae bacterium]
MDQYSFLNTAHTAYFAELYDQYLINPEHVEPSWRAFFQGFEFGIEESKKEKSVFEGVEVPDNILKEFKVVKLINAYRTRGHLFTKTNPVRDRRTYLPNLEIQYFDLSNDDLDSVFNAGEIIGVGATTLTNILIHLERIYCNSIGIEYMYIRTPERIQWIQEKLNHNSNSPDFSKDQKKQILKKIIEAVTFEKFLHTKYVGQKRFSLEGGEALIPALDALIEKAASNGVREFIVGMSHRGRLNTLTNIFGKPVEDIFNEFDGKDYEEKAFDGDVKYHLGWTSNRETDSGLKVFMNIAPNPSHLEAVGPVVQGIARAKQEKYHPNNIENVLPIIIHGDAAIAGQGVVYEVVQMERLKGYKTGGTIHIVVNNQVGFTTNYLDGRSSTYCTDVAKTNLCPVLHVNSDDVEAVVHAITFALDYRMKFKRDVFIDLLGYRKYGHNEGDEPRFTQPKLYKAISKHSNPMEIYSKKLIEDEIISPDYVSDIEKKYKESLEKKLENSKKDNNIEITPFMDYEWKGFKRVKKDKMLSTFKTNVSVEDLNKVAKTITTLPENKSFLKKIKKLIGDRYNMFFESNKLDWAMGEMLAYGTLLNEGYNVRISGQDVERGTFSHRHAILKVEDSEEEVCLLDGIDKNQGNFNIYNSSLSEYGVMGYEYGYSLTSPKTLCIWEAQFGDFSNGAQIMIDQYLSAAEAKWKTQNGLVLLLPHGYEGQGAEHSSGRMERYLQLCSKDNMYVANCSTPANMFHILRRQMVTTFRKPLIIFTPKSLLRHPKAVSGIEDFSKGKFMPVIDTNNNDVSKIDRLVFCSGKFYYDLLEFKEKNNINDTALVRLEQLFPLPELEIQDVLNKYSNAKDIVWAQEEPRNMGAWSYLLLHFDKARDFRVASRRFYSSPAAGSSTRSKNRHNEVIEYVFDKSKNNMK